VLDDLVADSAAPLAGEVLAIADEDDVGAGVAGEPPDGEPDVAEVGLAVARADGDEETLEVAGFETDELGGDVAKVVGGAPLALGEGLGEFGGGRRDGGVAVAGGELAELLEEVVELGLGEGVAGLAVSDEGTEVGLSWHGLRVREKEG
jgi:hypothetical protein